MNGDKAIGNEAFRWDWWEVHSLLNDNSISLSLSKPTIWERLLNFHEDPHPLQQIVYLSCSDKIARSPSRHKDRSTCPPLFPSHLPSILWLVTWLPWSWPCGTRTTHSLRLKPPLFTSPQQGATLSICTLSNMWWSLFAFVSISFLASRTLQTSFNLIFICSYYTVYDQYCGLHYDEGTDTENIGDITVDAHCVQPTINIIGGCIVGFNVFIGWDIECIWENFNKVKSKASKFGCRITRILTD